MAGCYFDLIEKGTSFPADEPLEFSGLSEAVKSAVGNIRSVLSATVLEGRVCLDGSLNIRDAAGTRVASIPFRDALEVC